jgi:hypothetical protein
MILDLWVVFLIEFYRIKKKEERKKEDNIK